MQQVRKRDGKFVTYDPKKIYACIRKANDDAKGDRMKKSDIYQIVEKVEDFFKDTKAPTVERIQDVVENALIESNFVDTAKEYIRYRGLHAKMRDAHDDLMKQIQQIIFSSGEEMDHKRQNANIASDTTMGAMLICGTTLTNYLNDNYIIPKEYIDAHRQGYIHIHDKDFSSLTWNCLTDDTIVDIKENGIKKSVRFDYFDKYFDDNQDKQWVDVSNEHLMALSKDGKYTKINKLLRRKNNEGIYDIRLKNGYSLKATKDHILELTNGNEVKVRELNIHDELPLAQYCFDDANSLQEINLIDMFDEDDTDIVLDDTEYINNCLSNDLKTFLDLRVNRFAGKNNSCKYTLKEYKLLRKFLIIDEHNLHLISRKAKHNNSISAILHLTSSLGKVVGYILSEGYIPSEMTHIIFGNQDKRILQDFKQNIICCFPNLTADTIFTHKSTSACEKVYVGGSVFAKLFKGILANKSLANNMSLPKWYEQANNDFIRGFFASMIDGDGSIQDDYRMRLGLVSKDIIYQMQRILAVRNIVTRVVYINSQGTIAKFSNGKSAIRNHDTWILEASGIYLDGIKTFLQSECFKVNNIKYNATKRKKPNYNTIVGLQTIEYDGYVYDFETENHFFVANGIISHNCIQIDLCKLFETGFSTGHGFIRPPQSIRAGASLACIAIQANQNDMFGGQSIAAFDYAMAMCIRKTFAKEFRRALTALLDFDDVENVDEIVKSIDVNDYPTYNDDTNLKNIKNVDEKVLQKAFKLACKRTEEETKQSMEAVIFNFNTLHSRSGAQVNIGA